MADGVLVDFPSMEYARYFPDLDSLLRYCTSRFLAAVSDAPNPDLTYFRTTIFRVLDAYLDPPLEAVWLFSAVTSYNTPDDVRSILRLVSAFTASSLAAAKPLALLAPVIYELVHSTKPLKTTETLVDAVLTYISLCSSRPSGGEVNADAGKLLPVFGELVKVSTVRNLTQMPPFEVLFPLVGNETRQELMKEGCSVTFLAGVVVVEAFLLRLCLKVRRAAGAQRSELRNELKIWAVSSIVVHQNQQFFEVLLNMLANPPLPVDSLLSADDEILVREILYDALILMDYSSFSGAAVDQSDSSLFPIFMSRLVTTVDAINGARCKGDRGREMLYISAFSTSNIASYLIGWVVRQAGTDQPTKLIVPFTPQAFLEWLEDKALKVLGENCSRIKERLMQHEGKKDNQSRISQPAANFFFIDKQSHQEGDTKGGEDEEAVEMETTDDAFMAAAHSMEVMAKGTKKTKDCETEVATVVMYKSEDSSFKDCLQATNGMSIGISPCK